MIIEINFRRIVIILAIVGLVVYITTQILEEFNLQDDPILPELKSKIAPLFSKDAVPSKEKLLLTTNGDTMTSVLRNCL